MQEVLFIGKRVDNGEWVEGDFVSNKYILQGYRVERGFVVPYNTFEVIPSTVGQFTGLLDKHGKKIFEGDIVKNRCCVTLRSGDNENKWDCTIMGVVTFREGGFRVKSSEFDFPVSNEYEVIGNIHDNPELLEVEND